VAAIADAYGFDSFAVAGRSGGGPHALACAALLPDRVSRAAVLVGLAPWGAEGLDWFDGMVESNVLYFTAAEAGFGPLAVRLMASADAIRADPASLIDGLLAADLTEDDRYVVADPGIRSLLIRSHQEALRTSAYGWIDDARAFCLPWGFDPAAVAVPVFLWHGERVLARFARAVARLPDS
jgi:pimeloyl-ACP methyl ester carboxylesterase